MLVLLKAVRVIAIWLLRVCMERILLPKQKMLFDFNFKEVGFSDEEWEEIPRTSKCVIRSYYLNGRDKEETMLYEFLQTDWKVRQTINRYHLKERPVPRISLADFCLC